MRRNVDASKKIFVAIGNLVFDFELFIGGRVQQSLTASSERWLKCRNEDAAKTICVATGILVFDFELFIGVHCDLLRHAVEQTPTSW